jgi:AAA family ATP:ADP antiporter
MNKRVLNDPKFDDLHYVKRKGEKDKPKQSFRESFRVLARSKYLIYIAIIVFAYNLVINLVEVVWKDQVRILIPDKGELNAYLNNLTSSVGVVSTILALCLPKMLSKFGWTGTALITPFIMLVTSLGFFGFYLGRDSLAEFALFAAGTTPLIIAVFFGFAQNCLSKACKYSVFDATKEMTFIPLDHQSKLKGKAAIDGVGSRFGKSGGSIIHMTLLSYFVTLNASAPYVAGILMVAIGLWIVATKRLGIKFKNLLDSKHESLEEAVPVQETVQPEPILKTATS